MTTRKSSITELFKNFAKLGPNGKNGSDSDSRTSSPSLPRGPLVSRSPSPQTPNSPFPFRKSSPRPPRTPPPFYFSPTDTAGQRAEFAVASEQAAKNRDFGNLKNIVNAYLDQETSSGGEIMLPKFLVDSLPACGSPTAVKEILSSAPWVRYYYRSNPQLLLPFISTVSTAPSTESVNIVYEVVRQNAGDEDGLVDGSCFSPWVSELSNLVEKHQHDSISLARAAACVLTTTDPQLPLYQLELIINLPGLDWKTVERAVRAFDFAESTMRQLVTMAKTMSKAAQTGEDKMRILNLLSTLAEKPFFLSSARSELLFVGDIIPWVSDDAVCPTVCDLFRKIEKQNPNATWDQEATLLTYPVHRDSCAILPVLELVSDLWQGINSGEKCRIIWLGVEEGASFVSAWVRSQDDGKKENKDAVKCCSRWCKWLTNIIKEESKNLDPLIPNPVFKTLTRLAIRPGVDSSCDFKNVMLSKQEKSQYFDDPMVDEWGERMSSANSSGRNSRVYSRYSGSGSSPPTQGSRTHGGGSGSGSLNLLDTLFHLQKNIDTVDDAFLVLSVITRHASVACALFMEDETKNGAETKSTLLEEVCGKTVESSLCCCTQPYCEARVYLDMLRTIYDRIFASLDHFLSPKTTDFVHTSLNLLSCFSPLGFSFLRFLLINLGHHEKVAIMLNKNANLSSTVVAKLIQALGSIYGKTLTCTHHERIPFSINEEQTLSEKYVKMSPHVLIVIRTATKSKMDSTVIEAIFCLMNGGDLSFSPTRPSAIHHPDVLPLLFENFASYSNANKALTLKLIASLFTGRASVVNKTICTQNSSPLILFVLETFDGLPAEAKIFARQILQEIGSFYITVSQVKKVFRLMQPTSTFNNSTTGECRSEHLEDVLCAMGGMIPLTQDPNRYFLLDGIASGFAVPSLPQAVFNAGYSFCFGFRMDIGAALPCNLFFFEDEKGSVKVSFEKVKGGHVGISVTVRRSGNVETSLFQGVDLAQGKWYRLGISHAISSSLTSGLNGGSKMTLVLVEMGTKRSQTSKIKVPAPSFAKGGNVRGEFFAGGEAHLFSGASGLIFGISFAIAAEQIEVLCRQKTVEHASIWGSKLALSVFVNSSSEEDISDKRGLVRHLRGTRVATRLNFADALSCMGGLDTVMPIFAQLDLPVKLAGSDIAYEHNQNLSVSLLKLVTDLVSKSESCRATMRSHGGFGIVSYLLKNLDPRHMTHQLVDAVFVLESEVTEHPVLHESVVMDLIANFNLWVFAETDVQMHLLNRTKMAVLNEGSKFGAVMRNSIGVHTLLDSLVFHFWYYPPTSQGNWPKLDKVYTEKTKLHVATGGVIGRRAEGEDLAKIRKCLFSVIHALLGTGGDAKLIDAKETEAIVNSLVQTNIQDDSTRVQMLELVLRILFNERQQISFVRCLRTAGFQALVSQIDHGSGTIQNYAVAIVVQVLHVYYIDPETVYPPRVQRSSQSSKALAGFNIYVPPPTLMRSLSSRTIELGASGSGGGAREALDSWAPQTTPTQNFYNPNAPPSNGPSNGTTGSETSSVSAHSPTRPKGGLYNENMAGSWGLEQSSTKSHNSKEDGVMSLQSGSSGLDTGNFSTCVPALLNWIKSKLSYNEEMFEGVVDSNSIELLPPDKPSPEIILKCLTSAMFKHPTHAFFNNCVVNFDALGYENNAATRCKQAFDSATGGNSHGGRISQERLVDLLKELENDIKGRTNSTTTMRLTSDAFEDAEACENFLRLPKNGGHYITFHEFYAWYITFYVSPDIDLDGAPNKRVVREGVAFVAALEYLGGSSIPEWLQIETLGNLLYVVECHENCLKLVSVLGWQQGLLKLLGGSTQVLELALRTLCEIHVSLICSTRQKVVLDSLTILKDTMSLVRVESMHGRLERGKEHGMVLLSMIAEALLELKFDVNLYSSTGTSGESTPRGSNDTTGGLFGKGKAGKKKGRVIPSDRALFDFMSIALEFILIPHQVGQGGSDGMMNGRLASQHLTLLSQFRLVNNLVELIGECESPGGGDILTDIRGLLRALVISLEQLYVIDDGMNSEGSLNGGSLEAEPGPNDSFDTQDSTVSKKPQTQPKFIPNKEIIKRTIYNLRSMLDEKKGRSEEAVFVCVRLVDLLRREWAGGRGSRSSSGGSQPLRRLFEEFCFPVEDLTQLVYDLCSSNSYLLWENLSLNVPLKAKPLNSFIRDRSESGFSESGFSEGGVSTTSAGEISDLDSVEDVKMNSTEDPSNGQQLSQLSNDPTLLAIAAGLCVDSDLLDWAQWDKAFAENLAFSLRQEDEAVLSRLDDLGLSDQVTTAMRKKMNAVNEIAMYRAQEIEDDIRSKVFGLRVKNEKRLVEYTSRKSMKSSKARQRWQGILEEMASERGPWGKQQKAEERSFWIMDESRDERGLRLKFKRNLRGTTHRVASQLTRGRKGGGGAGLVPGEAEVGKDFGRQGLMNDLRKYQRRATMVLGGEDYDETSVGAGFDDESVQGKGIASTIDSSKEGSAAEGRGANAMSYTFKNSYLVSTTTRTLGDIEVKREGKKDVINFIMADKSLQRDQIVDVRGDTASWAWVTEPNESVSFNVKLLQSIRFRRYMQQPISLELAFADCTRLIFAFESAKSCKEFHRVLRNVFKPKGLKPFLGMKPMQVLLKTKTSFNKKLVTKAWTQRSITNFDYLLALNDIAGRSMGDLTQYPVFPWVLSNYTSDNLDLNDPANYRDFKWPMGAQTEERREIARERYEGLASCYNPDELDARDALPPFHHGTHYSAPAFVIWYLMRLEPFTSMHIHLQNGRFDKPDRLFRSIEETYRSCQGVQGDVKEVIPEFFYLPDFLRNSNGLDLGKTQSGEAINDITLPAWAKTPEDFVRINRSALESDHVSANLHNWIDLVFGNNSRPPTIPNGGQGAVESCNVFFHLTYTDAVDLGRMKVEDPNLYDTYVKQIENFGSAPSLLFSQPHPPRISRKAAEEGSEGVVWPLASQPEPFTGYSQSKKKSEEARPNKINTWELGKLNPGPIIGTFSRQDWDSLITVAPGSIPSFNTLIHTEEDIENPFRFLHDAKFAGGKKEGVGFAGNGTGQFAGKNRLGMVGGEETGVGGRDMNLTGATEPQHFALAKVGPPTLYTCNHTDSAVLVYALERGSMIQTLLHHKDIVTCLHLTHVHLTPYLLTGSKDCTISIFPLLPTNLLPSTPLYTLYGHTEKINYLTTEPSLDICVSGSEDGNIIVHTLSKGKYVRTIDCNDNPNLNEVDYGGGGDSKQVNSSITWIEVTRRGLILTYSRVHKVLSCFTINGKLLSRRDDLGDLLAFEMSVDGRCLIVGGDTRPASGSGEGNRILFLDSSTLNMLPTLPNVRNTRGYISCKNVVTCIRILRNSYSSPALNPANEAALVTDGVKGSEESLIFVGFENGEGWLIGHDKGYLRKRLEKQLQSLGFF
ncbi:hypothetical protein TrVE_jg13060 [Triparma verrucosa]|uniref:Uncharacterized protein n=1 Tax=Triparma verrucosa TaxID=1606542 RepID=A0A9W7F8V3_9STRA|nr:hypothetical protein TrVE_jg13060 [Triparma verrucosa]